MGLNLSVGHLADVQKHDAEGAEKVRADFARLNAFLESKKLPAHTEPQDIKPFSCQMWGYGGLHYLRRFAAHLHASGKLPTPGNAKELPDPLVEARFAGSLKKRSFLRRWLGGAKTPAFEHLILHSDAEGYYLPQDFADVLVALPPEWKIPGGLIGSAPRLLAECEHLARVLELPLTLHAESREVIDAAKNQGKYETLWKRYGVESFTCLQLHSAATYSVKTGAAVVFC